MIYKCSLNVSQSPKELSSCSSVSTRCTPSLATLLTAKNNIPLISFP